MTSLPLDSSTQGLDTGFFTWILFALMKLRINGLSFFQGDSHPGRRHQAEGAAVLYELRTQRQHRIEKDTATQLSPLISWGLDLRLCWGL